MASSPEFVKYACDQLNEDGGITCKKLFGEYGVYYKNKFIACICDDQLLIKITEAGKKLLPEGATALPYEGAKPYFLIENLENTEFLKELLTATYEELPIPKPKKK